MNKQFKGILFLLNVLFIFFTEFILYIVMKDYCRFINTLSIRLSSVNILCVKIFQAIASNNDLIDEKTNNQLLQFTDNVPWTYADIDLQELVTIADTYNLSLKYGYEIPINAGMISIVFKAYKKDNDKPVIIKMKRNNIEKQLNDGIDNLLFVIYALSFIPLFNKYQISEVIHKNIEIIKHQTNFLQEVDNMNLIKSNCKNIKYVKIPTSYRHVTETHPNCILMEFIEGVKINQIDKTDYQGFAKQVMKFGFVTTIVHGITHGDLHSGNILFIKDINDTKYPYKIGVIDFGIIYELEQGYKEVLFTILSQMFELPARDTAIRFLNSGIIDPPGIIEKIAKSDYENILQFTTEIIDETIHSSKKANQVQIYKFISKLKTYLTNSTIANIGIKPSDNFVKTQLVLAMSHGVTLTLCDNDFMSLADTVLNELFHVNMMISK